MKFSLFSLLFLCFCSFLTVNAKFSNIDVDPECLLDGTTRTKPYHGRSDTSSWSIPVLYKGECVVKDALNDTQKERVFVTFRSYFLKHGYISENASGKEWVYESMNEKGRAFVNDIYFPLLKKLLLAEYEREDPSDKKIALYRYAVQIIGYDYRIQK